VGISAKKDSRRDENGKVKEKVKRREERKKGKKENRRRGKWGQKRDGRGWDGDVRPLE